LKALYHKGFTEQVFGELLSKQQNDQKEQLLNHTLYQKVQTLENLHCFLETHVYAVWDFMSLLKALQAKLTCTTTPWFASPNPETRYLINEIVLAEETDLSLDGRHLSHFEMYLEAMTACGATTTGISTFLEEIQSIHNIFVAIKKSKLICNHGQLGTKEKK
jgi:hypothetical protein